MRLFCLFSLFLLGSFATLSAGDVEIERFKRQFVLVDAKDPVQVALWQAAGEGKIDVVARLIRTDKANPNIANGGGDRLMCLMVGDDPVRLKILAILLEQGNPNLTGAEKKTPLELAIERGHVEAVRILKKKTNTRLESSSGKRLQELGRASADPEIAKQFAVGP